MAGRAKLLPGRNTIRITQHGLKPDETLFRSVSLYRRIA
jgi:hypothetical protein